MSDKRLSTIVLLGTSREKDAWMATDACTTYSFCRPTSEQPDATVALLVPRPFSEYAGYSAESKSFIMGDPDSERIGIAVPPEDHVTVCRHPTALKDRFFSVLTQKLKAMRAADVLLIAVFAHGERKDGSINIGKPGQYVTLSIKEMQAILHPFSHCMPRLWFNSCYSGHWAKEGFPWVALTAAGKTQESLSLRRSDSFKYRGGLHVFGVVHTTAQEHGIRWPYAEGSRQTMLVTRPPHDFAEDHSPLPSGLSIGHNLRMQALADRANAFTNIQPSLYDAVATASKNSQIGFPWVPWTSETISSFRLIPNPKPLPVMLPSTPVRRANVACASLKERMMSVDQSALRYSHTALERYIITFWEVSEFTGFTREVEKHVECLITDASSAYHFNTIGDILAKQEQCYTDIYIFAKFGPWQVTFCDSKVPPEEQYRQWLFDAASMVVTPDSDPLSEFLVSANMDLNDLLCLTGAVATFDGVEVCWLLAARWFASLWVNSGRREFTISNFVLTQLWGWSTLRQDYTALTLFLVDLWSSNGVLRPTQSVLDLALAGNDLDALVADEPLTGSQSCPT